MYYVITESGIRAAKTLKAINKKLNGKLEEAEMQHVGPDKIINLTSKDLEFIRDKKRLSDAAIKSMFKKDNMHVWLLWAVIVLEFINLVKG